MSAGDLPTDPADRFIAGEDRLSALLKAIPAFAPPAALAAAVAEAARAAQAEANRARTVSASASAPDRATQPLTFAPPAELAAGVLQEAARVQAAQAARRDALLAKLAAGTSAEEALGGPVSEPTQAWLRLQARAHGEPAARHAGRDTGELPGRRAWSPRWWRSLGLAASTIAVAGLATHIVLRQIDEGALPGDAAQVVEHREAAQPTAPAPSVAAPAASVTNPPAGLPGNGAASGRVQTPDAPAPRKAPAPVGLAESKPPAAAKEARTQASPLQPPAAAQPAIPAAPAAPAAPPVADALPSIVPPPAPVVAAPAPAMESAPAASPPAAMAMRRAPSFAAAPRPVAPAPDTVTPSATMNASAQSAAGGSAEIRTLSLLDDPAAVAAQWRRHAASLRLAAAEPDSAEVRDWVRRLWEAMPVETRPAVPYAVQADGTLPPGQLRIEGR